MAAALAAAPAAAVPPAAANTVAVVKGRYDDVELVLSTYKIPFDTIEYRDLDNEETYKKYRSIFFPCGVVPSMNERINLVAQRNRIQSVSLKDDFREPGKDATARCIRDFAEGGGALYFSGYAFDLLQRAYSPFLFHDGFPHVGLPGRIESKLMHDISRFCVKTKMALYMEHSGWIAPRAAMGEVIVSGKYDTPRGEKSGPLSVLIRKGDGEILYTSYHSTVFSDFRRFNIYRIAGSPLLKRTAAMAERWDQTITGKIVDAFHSGENHRMYYLNLGRGNNTVYYQTPDAPMQIDVFDEKMSLIVSRDSFDRSGSFDIVYGDSGYCFVRVYPSTRQRFRMFALVSAHGPRIIPHANLLLKIGLGVAAVFAIAVLKRLFFGRRYSGRFGM